MMMVIGLVILTEYEYEYDVYSVFSNVFLPIGSLYVNVDDAYGTLHGRWRYEQNNWPHLHDDGEMTVKLSDISILLMASVALNVSQYDGDDGMVMTSRLAVRSSSSSPRVGNWDMSISNSNSYFYDFMCKLFKDDIEDEMTEAMQISIDKYIDMAVQTVQNVRYRYDYN